jgi:hypothetical protein
VVNEHKLYDAVLAVMSILNVGFKNLINPWLHYLLNLKQNIQNNKLRGP